MKQRPQWARNAVRKLYHVPPPTFWRRLNGLFRDIASIPRRLRDPSRRSEPSDFLHHVGGGDFKEVGRAWLETLLTIGKLEPHDRILDIGCGNGRMASPIIETLSKAGSYVGFDISKSAIDYCNHKFATEANVHFHLLDIRNGIYNPRGDIADSAVVFPVPENSVSLAFATSVFTHLTRPAACRYLEETARVLLPGGRALFTAFVLTPATRAAIAAGRTHIAMQPFDEASMVADPLWPETAIAFDEAGLREMVATAGLTVESLFHGAWSGSTTYGGGQDLLVIRKHNLSGDDVG